VWGSVCVCDPDTGSQCPDLYSRPDVGSSSARRGSKEVVNTRADCQVANW